MTEENTQVEVPESIQNLLDALQEAKAEKDQALARKIRRLLRNEGWHISKGGFIGNSEIEAKAKAKKERAKERRAKRRAEKETTRPEENPESEEYEPYFEYSKDWNNIKTQYRELAKEFHPDNGGSTEAMQRINDEYEALKKAHGK